MEDLYGADEAVNKLTMPGNNMHHFVLSIEKIKRTNEWTSVLKALVHENCKVNSLELNFAPDSVPVKIWEELVDNGSLWKLFETVLPQRNITSLSITCHHYWANEKFAMHLIFLILEFVKKAETLHELNLHNMIWKQTFARDLASVLPNCNINRIIIQSANRELSDYSTNDCMIIIIEALQNRIKVTELLSITDIIMRDACFEKIATLVRNGKIQELALRRTFLRQDDFQKICAAMKSRKNKLSSLDIYDNHVSNETPLLESLQDENNKLQYLDVAHNPASFSGLYAIADHEHVKLVALHMQKNLNRNSLAEYRNALNDILGRNDRHFGNIRIYSDSLPILGNPVNYLRNLYNRSLLDEYWNFSGDEQPPEVKRIRERVNSQWFKTLILLLCHRTRPHLYIKELVKPLGLTLRFKEEEEEE